MSDRVLVTGGLGFIGSTFIRYMLGKHRVGEIINIDNLSYGANPANLRSCQNDPRYTFVRGDVTDRTLMSKLVGKVDLVFNFAAESHVDRSIADSWPFMRSNTEGVLTLLDAVKSTGKGVRLIQVGTDEVYGDIKRGSASETYPLNPSSPYAASKAAADEFCLAYGRTYGVKVMIARCTNNFGPFQFPEKLIPKTIVRALRNLPVPIYGSGKQVRDWNYVENHCEALDLIARRGRPGEIYNISTGHELDNISVVKSVLEQLGKKPSLVKHVKDRPGHDVRYSLDSGKIRRELGWKPHQDFDESLRRTVEWYVRNESWWMPLADKKILSPEPWKMEW